MATTSTKRNTARFTQLMQLTKVTWDGNILSKSTRDQLIQEGYAQRYNGWNWLTLSGVMFLDHLAALDGLILNRNEPC